MALNKTVPTIAITSEAVDDLCLNLEDSITDVEDLDVEVSRDAMNYSKRSKSNLKIKLTDTGSTTDLEDLEASNSEEETVYPRSVSMEDIELETATTEETCKIDAKGKKRKLYYSVAASVKDQHVLQLAASDVNFITDVEDFDASDDEKKTVLPDIDLNSVVYQQNDVETVCEGMRENFKIAVSPCVTPTPSDYGHCKKTGMSHHELATKKKFRKQKHRNYRASSMFLTENCGSGARIENFSESDDEPSKQVFVQKKMRGFPKNINIVRLNDVLTDTEEIESDVLQNTPISEKGISSFLPDDYATATEFVVQSNEPVGNYLLDVLNEQVVQTDTESLSDAEGIYMDTIGQDVLAPELSDIECGVLISRESLTSKSANGIEKNYLLFARETFEDKTDTEDLDATDNEALTGRNLNVPDNKDGESTDVEILSVSFDDMQFDRAVLKKCKLKCKNANNNLHIPQMDGEDDVLTCTEDISGDELESYFRIGTRIQNVAHGHVIESEDETHTDIEDMFILEEDDNVQNNAKNHKSFSVDLTGDNITVTVKRWESDFSLKLMNHEFISEKYGGSGWDAAEGNRLTKETTLTQDTSHIGDGSWQSPSASTDVLGATPKRTDGAAGVQDEQGTTAQQRVPDQQELSREMKELLKEMEKGSKQ